MTLARAALSTLVAAALGAAALQAHAVDQTLPGAGNAQADQTAAASPRVREAHEFLLRQARQIRNRALREATLDLLGNRGFCVRSRVGVDDATKAALLAKLAAASLVNPADDAAAAAKAAGGKK